MCLGAAPHPQSEGWDPVLYLKWLQPFSQAAKALLGVGTGAGQQRAQVPEQVQN